MKKIPLSIVLSLLLVAPIAHSDIAGDMDSFFNGAINVTDPGVSHSQMGGMYTGGSLSLRVPSKTVTPLQINLPSYSGGCNGIDVFTGAFSHISSDQLIALGKAIAANTGPFAFDLAVSTLSPAIQQAYEKLRRLANMVNQFQINSCEQTASMVANLWPWESNKAVTSSVCKSLGQRRGFFSDGAAAKFKCDNQGQGPSVANTARNDPDFAGVLKDNTNSTWSALGKSNMVSDDQMKRLVMTLVGTVVNKAATTESGQAKFDYIPAKGGEKEFLNAFLHGGKIKIHKCDEKINCLAVTESAEEIEIKESKSFVSLVRTMINELEGIARTQDQKMTGKHIGFLNRTTLPIYKMILVDIAYSRGGSSVANPESYAEVVALDYFYNYLNGLLDSIYQAVSQEYASSNDPSILAWRKDIRSLQQNLQGYIKEKKDTIDVHTKMMEKTMQLEKMMASNVTNQVMSAFNYSLSL